MPECDETWVTFRTSSDSVIVLGDPNYLRVQVTLSFYPEKPSEIELVLPPWAYQLTGDPHDSGPPMLAALHEGLKRVMADLEKAMDKPTSRRWS